MANKISQIYESPITAQASAVIAADADSSGALTIIDNSLAGNGKGCMAYKCFVNVVTAPVGGDAVARVKYAGRTTGTPDAFDNGSIGVTIPAGYTGEKEVGDIVNPAPVSSCKLAAEQYGFEGALIVVPIMPEAQ